MLLDRPLIHERLFTEHFYIARRPRMLYYNNDKCQKILNYGKNERAVEYLAKGKKRWGSAWLDQRGITLVFACLACVIALLIGTSIVSAAYGGRMRAAMSVAERKSELIALSGARLLLDFLDGASITIETVTVYSGGQIYIDEAREGGAEFKGESLARSVMEAAYGGGGTAAVRALCKGQEITWLCEFSGLEKDEIGRLDIGAPLLISVMSGTEGGKAGETASVCLTAAIREYSEKIIVEGGEYECLHRTYTYLLSAEE